MFPFGVTIPATVQKGSEIPEGITNNPVYICYTKWRRLEESQDFVWRCLKSKSVMVSRQIRTVDKPLVKWIISLSLPQDDRKGVTGVPVCWRQSWEYFWDSGLHVDPDFWWFNTVSCSIFKTNLLYTSSTDAPRRSEARYRRFKVCISDTVSVS